MPEAPVKARVTVRVIASRLRRARPPPARTSRPAARAVKLTQARLEPLDLSAYRFAGVAGNVAVDCCAGGLVLLDDQAHQRFEAIADGLRNDRLGCRIGGVDVFQDGALLRVEQVTQGPVGVFIAFDALAVHSHARLADLAGCGVRNTTRRQ